MDRKQLITRKILFFDLDFIRRRAIHNDEDAILEYGTRKCSALSPKRTDMYSRIPRAASSISGKWRKVRFHVFSTTYLQFQSLNFEKNCFRYLSFPIRCRKCAPALEKRNVVICDDAKSASNAIVVHKDLSCAAILTSISMQFMKSGSLSNARIALNLSQRDLISYLIRMQFM